MLNEQETLLVVMSVLITALPTLLFNAVAEAVRKRQVLGPFLILARGTPSGVVLVHREDAKAAGFQHSPGLRLGVGAPAGGRLPHQTG